MSFKSPLIQDEKLIALAPKYDKFCKYKKSQIMIFDISNNKSM